MTDRFIRWFEALCIRNKVDARIVKTKNDTSLKLTVIGSSPKLR